MLLLPNGEMHPMNMLTPKYKCYGRMMHLFAAAALRIIGQDITCLAGVTESQVMELKDLLQTL